MGGFTVSEVGVAGEVRRTRVESGRCAEAGVAAQAMSSATRTSRVQLDLHDSVRTNICRRSISGESNTVYVVDDFPRGRARIRATCHSKEHDDTTSTSKWEQSTARVHRSISQVHRSISERDRDKSLGARSNSGVYAPKPEGDGGSGRVRRSNAQHARSISPHDGDFTRPDRSFTRHDRSFTRHDRSFTRHDRSFARHDRGFARHNRGLHPGSRRLHPTRPEHSPTQPRLHPTCPEHSPTRPRLHPT